MGTQRTDDAHLCRDDMSEGPIEKFNFPELTIGLPDSVFRRSDGKLEEALIRGRLRLDRRQSKFFNKMLKNRQYGKMPKFVESKFALINHNASPIFREQQVENTLILITAEINAKLVKGDAFQAPVKEPVPYNWDLLTLYEYAPDLWEESGQDDEGLREHDDFGNAYSNIPDWVREVCWNIRERAVAELDSWNNLTLARRAFLAEVHFSLGFTLGIHSLTAICSSHPQLLPFYSSITALKENQRTSGTSIGESPSAASPDVAVPGDTMLRPESFHEEIQNRLDKAKSLPADPSRAQELKEIVDDLNQWYIDNPIAISFKEELFPTLVVKMQELGELARLEGFTGAIHQSFFACWLKYVTSEEVGNASEDFFVKYFLSAKKTINRSSKKFGEVLELLVTLEDAIRKKGGEKPESRTERREKDAELSRLNSELTEARSTSYEMEDELHVAILPPGEELEVWESSSVAPDNSENDVSDETLVALGRFYTYIQQPDNFIDEGFASENDEEAGAHGLTEFSIKTAEPDKPDAGARLEETSVSPEMAAENTESQGEALFTQGEPLARDQEELPDSELEPETESEAALVLTETKGDSSSAKKSEPGSTQGPVAELEDIQPVSVKNNLQQQCVEQLREDGAIEDHLFNDALSKLMLEGRFEMAVSLARINEERDFCLGALPLSLLRGAYYGYNVWSFDRSFSKSQKILNTFSPAVIDSWTQVREGGRAVPFLVFVAALQPALFAGSHSNAGVLLESLKGHFEGPMDRLIELATGLYKQGKMLSVSNLRSQVKEDSKTDEVLQQELDAWEQRIVDARRGYAPIRKAQAYCLEKGEFGVVVDTLRTGSLQQAMHVQQFVSKYQDKEASDALLDELLGECGHEDVRGAVISTGKDQFYHKISDLVELGQRWLAEKSQITGGIDEIARNLKTLLPQVMQSLKTIFEDLSNPDDRRAGSKIALASLENLRRVIDGNDAPIWTQGRAKAWMHHPQQLLRLVDLEEDPAGQVVWLIGQTENPISYEDILSLAQEKGEVSLGALMFMALRDRGDNRKTLETEIMAQFAEMRSVIKKKCQQLIANIDTAVLTNLVSVDRSLAMIAEIEDIQDAIEVLEPFNSVYWLNDRVARIHDEISHETGSKLKSMEADYREELEKIRGLISGNPVPQEWISTMEAAIGDENLMVVDEMLDEIQTAVKDGRSIEYESLNVLPLLQEFKNCESELYSEIMAKSTAKELWDCVAGDNHEFAGLDFKSKPAPLRKVIDAIYGWKNTKPASEINDVHYKAITSVLGFLGIPVSPGFKQKSMKASMDYRSGNGFSSFFVNVKPIAAGVPFPMFQGDSTRAVVIAHNEWVSGDLMKYIRQTGMLASDPILISATPMSRRQRQEFSDRCKQDGCTVMHVDIVLTMFLASQQRDTAGRRPIDNFLWSTVPWTYFNPYIQGDTRKPPPREMRFGRTQEIKGLMDMNNGKAIVFGGRQLGKSTIIQEVKERFHQPERKQLAFYEVLDKMMDRTDISKAAWKSKSALVWGYVYSHLTSAGLIDGKIDKSDPEKMAQAVELALATHEDHKVIMIFDEIDPILNLDSAHDFQLFRRFRDLVYKFHGRFKIIIAGLENVKRFEDSPNNPLTQLGGPLPVSIMSTRDALHLVQKPMYAAGYSFEGQVLNQILIDTNRHPGLLQIFCHELISALASNRRGEVGTRKVTMADVRNVRTNPDVISLIRSRFDMTLHLDRRYGVIVYGLLCEDKGIRPFTPREAKEIAASWLPSAFEQLTITQFAAFLDELVGLGVLKAIREDQRTQYQLRNANIRRLIGTDEEELNNKLLRAVEQHNTNSPMDRHEVLESAGKYLLCPINFGDEKGLFGLESPLDEEGQQVRIDTHRKYTASIVVGSKALGQEIIGESLSMLYPAEYMEDAKAKRFTAYKLFARYDADFPSPKAFEDRMTGLLSVNAKKEPILVLITVTGNQPLSHVTSMIDAANNLHGSEKDFSENLPFRIVFSLSPKAYWQWVTQPELTEGRELTQPFINLALWNTSAIAHLLDRIEMVNTPEEIEKVLYYSEGWHYALDKMASHKYGNKEILRTADLGEGFKPIDTVKPKHINEFIDDTGLKDVPWAEAFLREVSSSWCDNNIDSSFTQEALALSLEESEIFGDEVPRVAQVVAWLSNLALIRRVGGRHDFEDPGFKISRAVGHALGLVDVE